MIEAAVTKETGGGALGVPAAARVGAENGLGDFLGERAWVHTCFVNQPEVSSKELSLSRELYIFLYIWRQAYHLRIACVGSALNTHGRKIDVKESWWCKGSHSSNSVIYFK